MNLLLTNLELLKFAACLPSVIELQFDLLVHQIPSLEGQKLNRILSLAVLLVFVSMAAVPFSVADDEKDKLVAFLKEIRAPNSESLGEYRYIQNRTLSSRTPPQPPVIIQVRLRF